MNNYRVQDLVASTKYQSEHVVVPQSGQLRCLCSSGLSLSDPEMSDVSKVPFFFPGSVFLSANLTRACSDAKRLQ